MIKWLEDFMFRLSADHATATTNATDMTLKTLIADVARAAATPLSGRDRCVAAALQPYLGQPDLLPEGPRQSSPERYARHLLHGGTDYTILALVWRPRQMSTVHAHRTWCAFGLHQGWLVETLFSPGQQGVVLRDCLPRRAGDISHSPEDVGAVHRLANLGTETVISIHVYGARYDRLGEQVNTIWAE
jgi:predicted metal-dependent enzyme (double-stranded beta helix superfamily)